MARLLTPCELSSWFSSPAAEKRVAVGGRVVSVEGPELKLADAWNTVLLLSDSWPAAVQDGDLLELLVEPLTAGPGYAARQLLRHTPGRPGAEVGRLLHGGRGHALLGRDRALRAARAYFHEQSFIEVETPSFVPCPGLDAHVHSLAAVVRGERTDFLITSPELHMKRLLVAGVPRIFQVARAFRAEELGTWHEPEFTLLEWYRAFADYEEVLSDTEELVRRVATAVAGQPELVVRTSHGTVTLDCRAPFSRVTVADAFREFAGIPDVVGLLAEDEARYYELLVSAVEPGLARLGRPVFLTHYPAAHAALARRDAVDPRYAERFELYAAGVELCNGYGELTVGAEQRLRFELEQARRREAQEPVYPLDERFLAALDEGLPRASGNALGFDRLLALCLGAGDLASTLAFPDVDR